MYKWLRKTVFTHPVRQLQPLAPPPVDQSAAAAAAANTAAATRLLLCFISGTLRLHGADIIRLLLHLRQPPRDDAIVVISISRRIRRRA